MARHHSHVSAAVLAASSALALMTAGGCSSSGKGSPAANTGDAADDTTAGFDSSAEGSAEDSPADAPSDGAQAGGDDGSQQSTGDAPSADAPGTDGGGVGKDGATDSSALHDAAGPCAFSSSQVACTSICNTAPVVTVAASTASPPAAAGGSIATGVYYLQSITYYFPSDAGVPPSTNTTQQTLVVSAAGAFGSMDLIVSDDGAPSFSATYEYAETGSDLLLTATCPAPALPSGAKTAQTTLTYTATSTGVELFVPQPGLGGGPYLYVAQYGREGPYDGGPLLSDASGATDAGDAGNGADASCAAGAQGGCNSLCNSAPPAPIDGLSPEPPTHFTAGTIADGAYYLVSKTVYEPADSGADGGPIGSMAETLVISTSGGVQTWQDVSNVGGGANVSWTGSAYAETSWVFVSTVCPAPSQQLYRYTYNNSELDLYTPAGSGPASLSVYAKL